MVSEEGKGRQLRRALCAMDGAAEPTWKCSRRAGEVVLFVRRRYTALQTAEYIAEVTGFQAYLLRTYSPGVQPSSSPKAAIKADRLS